MSREDDYEKIDLVLRALRAVWRKTPSKRLGQLLVDIDCESKVPDLFFLSDFDLIKILDTKYSEYMLLEAKLGGLSEEESK